jgi:uncharacterized protein (DUF486 family)
MKILLAPLLIYAASWCYILAQYYHLSLTNWTLVKAAAIALPLVLIEYSFALNGNKLASITMSPTQILLMTIGFYVLNILLLNMFIFKQDINIARDLVAFALIIGAILISSNTRL